MESLDKRIIKMYNENNKSTYEIAESLGTYPNKIRRTLQKHGIKSMEEFGGIVHDGGEETLYGARYQQFIPILMKAVQELSAEIKELKEKN